MPHYTKPLKKVIGKLKKASKAHAKQARVLSKINTEGVLSGSAQIASEISGSGFVSATNDFEELTLTSSSISISTI